VTASSEKVIQISTLGSPHDPRGTEVGLNSCYDSGWCTSSALASAYVSRTSLTTRVITSWSVWNLVTRHRALPSWGRTCPRSSPWQSVSACPRGLGSVWGLLYECREVEADRGRRGACVFRRAFIKARLKKSIHHHGIVLPASNSL
jgi:hypothetical protein